MHPEKICLFQLLDLHLVRAKL